MSWRNGTKGRLEARFAAVRVRTADGPTAADQDMGQQDLPGDEAWLIGGHRNVGREDCLANMPAKTNLRTLAATIKARWICEQTHQKLKEEIGLDHFEGRSWQRLHRHALMTMISYAFFQHRLAHAGRKDESTVHRLRLSLPAARQAIVDLIVQPRPQRGPYCRRQSVESNGVNKSAKVVLVFRPIAMPRRAYSAALLTSKRGRGGGSG